MSNHWALAVLAVAALGGCGEEAAGGAPSNMNPVRVDAGGVPDGGTDGGTDVALGATNGLRLRARYRQPPSFTGQSAGHLNELTLLDDELFVANGQDAFSTLRVGSGGAVESVSDIPVGLAPQWPQFCTTTAVHRASRTLFCGYAQSPDGAIAAFDLTDARAPRLRDASALRDPRLTPRRLHIVGDTLYLAAFQAGLLAATIAPSGALEGLRETGVTGDVRFVDGDAARLVALDHALGLRVLRPDGGAWSVAGSLALAGPKLGLRVVADQALVALGSEGAAIVDLGGTTPREVLRLRPPGVVTSIDRQGALVAVSCTSGVFLYDVGGAQPTLRGWAPARSIMLDVRFHRGDLVVADWEDVAQYSVSATGVSDLVEVGWGQFIGVGTLPLGLRNPGDRPRGVEVVTSSGARLQQVLLAPGETRVVELAPTAVSTDRAPLVQGTVSVRASPAIPGVNDQQSVRFVFRGAPGPAAPPGVGDAMPPFSVARSASESLRLPLSGQTTRYVFYSHDCAAVWPQVEDLSYLASVQRLPLDATPVLIAKDDPARLGFTRRFAIENLLSGYYGAQFDAVPAEVRSSVAPYGEDLYYSTFQIRELRGGAAHPTDYVVAPNGRVLRVERIYRGAYPLP